MKMKKDTQLNFQIKGVELIDLCINVPIKPLSTETVFNFDLSLEHRINPEKDSLVVACSVSVYNENKEFLLGKLSAGCLYLIKDLDHFINIDSKAPELPEPVTTTLNSVSISTTRGLMFAMFRGTFLHNAILPIVDPSSFVILMR